MAPSPKVRTYDLQPEMAAARGDRAAGRGDPLGRLRPDRGRTTPTPTWSGIPATSRRRSRRWRRWTAGSAQALAALEAVGGAMIVTADHGNCEVMVDPATGGPHTAHTLNPVPVVLVGGPAGARLRDGGGSPTSRRRCSALMGLAPPPEMTGAEPDRGGMMRAAALLLAAGLAALPAAPATDRRGGRRPVDAARQRRWRRRARRRIRRRGAQRRAIADHEAALAALARGGDRRRGRASASSLSAWPSGARRSTRLLAALQALGRDPPPEPGLHPQGPLAAARAAAMLDAARARRSRARAEALDGRACGACGGRGGCGVDGGGELGDGAGRAERRRGRTCATAVAAAPPLVPEPDPALDDDGARERDADRARRGARRRRRRSARRRRRAAARCPGRSPGAVLRGFDEPDAAGVRRPGLADGGAAALAGARARRTRRCATPDRSSTTATWRCSSRRPGRWWCWRGSRSSGSRAGDEVRRGELLGLLGGARARRLKNM